LSADSAEFGSALFIKGDELWGKEEITGIVEDAILGKEGKGVRFLDKGNYKDYRIRWKSVVLRSNYIKGARYRRRRSGKRHSN